MCPLTVLRLTFVLAVTVAASLAGGGGSRRDK